MDINWVELRPIGDVDIPWTVHASADMKYICARHPTKNTIVMALYISSDYGSSWTNTSPEGTAGTTSTGIVCMSGNGKYIYAGTQTTLYRSDDYGVTWAVIYPNTAAFTSYSCGCVSYDGRVVAIGMKVPNPVYNYHVLYMSYDYGATWVQTKPTSLVAQTNVVALAISGNGNYVYASLDDYNLAYNKYRLYRSEDYGVTWQYVEYTGLDYYTAISCNYYGNVVIVARNSAFWNFLHVSDDYGASFGASIYGGQQIGINGSGVDSTGNIFMVGANTIYTNPPLGGLIYTSNMGEDMYEAWPAGYLEQSWSKPCVSLDGTAFLASNSTSIWIGNVTSSLINIDISWWN